MDDMSGLQPKLAVFLGAGFSMAWGLPLASEVMNPIAQAAFPGRWQRELLNRVQSAWQTAQSKTPDISVDEFSRHIQRANGLYGLSVRDFTTFLALRLSKSHWQVGRARETKWGTGDHVRKQRDIPKPYGELVRGLRNSELTGVITTNYDIVVEKLLGPMPSGRLGGFRYGVDDETLIGRHAVSSQYTYGPVKVSGKVPLLKLHGSLNWELQEDLKLVKYIDTRPSRGQRYTPLVLPPGDSEAQRLLDSTWKNAEQALRDGIIWLICGYSLPEYDEDIKKLLKDSASDGQRIVIMDPNYELISEKFRSILVSPRITAGPSLCESFESRHLTSAISSAV